MQARSIEHTMRTIKMFSTYMNDDHMHTIKLFVSAMFSIDYSVIESMLTETVI